MTDYPTPPNLGPLFPKPLKFSGIARALGVKPAAPEATFEQPIDHTRAAPIAQAAAHAERDVPGWKAEALAFLRTFAAHRGTWTGEELVAAAKAAGITSDDDRAWGGIVQGAANRGEIVKCGAAPRALNGSLQAVWKAK